MTIRGVGHESLTSKAAITAFVGRRKELTETRALLADSRLLTLTGPGGVGKTRLAVELSTRSAKQFRDGVWMVDLASLTRDGSVASLVGAFLDIPDQSNRRALDRVVSYLQEKELLLVLDNCEHVLAGCVELLIPVLATAPGVKVLTTSREPLGMTGEHTYPVPPLGIPAVDGELTAQHVQQSEAVAFLVDRARAVVGSFSVTDENYLAVAELCTRLDGMPLAIELAATRLRSLSVTQVLDRLDQRFTLLSRGDSAARPRHRTLQALIDWSYDLCTPREQLLWQRLAVFPAGFDLDAAEAVCGVGELEQHEVLDLLDRLVAQSILLTERHGTTVRYRQLVTVREYGAERLDEHAEAELRRRHLEVYLHRAEAVVAQWCGPRQGEFILQSRTERSNYRAALLWSLNTPGEVARAARLATALRYPWVSDGALSDARTWYESVVNHPQLQDGPELANALWSAAWVALLQGDHQDGAAHLQRCRELAAHLQDPALDAHADHWTALHHLFVGELPQAIELYQSAVAGHRAVGDTASSLIAEFQLGMAQVFHGDPAIALATCQDALAVAEQHGEQWARAYAYWISGICHWMLGDYAAAQRAATHALTIQRECRDAICIALTIELLAWVATSTERYDRAQDLSDVAASVWRGLGTTVAAFGPHIHMISTASAKRCARGLDTRTLERPYAQRTLSKEEATSVALAPESDAPAATEHPLTDTELCVARLVAHGLTNKQAAAQLVVSPRTVEGHVGRILDKLHFTSRTQIAAWAQSLPAAE